MKLKIQLGVLVACVIATPGFAATHKHATAKAPSPAVQQANAGLAAFDKGDFDQAIDLLTQALATGKLSTSDQAYAYVLRGRAHFAKHQMPETISDETQALQLGSTDEAAYKYRGRASLFGGPGGVPAGDADACLSDLGRIAQTTRDPEAIDWHGDCFFRKQQYNEALGEYTAAIRLDPNYAVAYVDMANSYNALKAWDLAIASATKAIALEPNKTNAYFTRGTAYSWKGDWDSWIADMNQVLVLSPRNAGAFAYRGIAYSRKGAPEQALADLDQALSIAPNFQQAVKWRSDVQAALNARQAQAAAQQAQQEQAAQEQQAQQQRDAEAAAQRQAACQAEMAKATVNLMGSIVAAAKRTTYTGAAVDPSACQ